MSNYLPIIVLAGIYLLAKRYWYMILAIVVTGIFFATVAWGGEPELRDCGDEFPWACLPCTTCDLHIGEKQVEEADGIYLHIGDSHKTGKLFFTCTKYTLYRGDVSLTSWIDDCNFNREEWE